jgi:hypothetical protein
VTENFKFDTVNLSLYDQIWLLGYDSGSSSALSTAERDAIVRFMQNGGGVFATGDHASLGSSLASTLPRVRSMRHWQSPPPPLGATRVDTTMPDANGTVVFENQSDDIPQNLMLKWYTWRDWYFVRQVFPHPLLCSSSGPITQFPDHMHEGEVVEPAVLTDVMSVDGHNFDEYPTDANGQRVAPEVVAWGWTGGYADPEVMHGIHVGDPGTSNKRWTGTVGAYDGKRAGVGRVVVDSTWHHFFDINLIGDNAANRPAFTDPRKTLWSQGFTYSTAGQQVLHKIDQYFRNIAYWLSPGVGLLRFTTVAAKLAVDKKVTEVMQDEKITAKDLGLHAWEVAVRLFPPCTVVQLNQELLDSIRKLKPVPFGPWDIPDPAPDGDPPRPPIPPVAATQAALGAAILAVHELGREALSKEGAERVGHAAVHGVRQLLVDRAASLKRELEELDDVVARFEQ